MKSFRGMIKAVPPIHRALSAVRQRVYGYVDRHTDYLSGYWRNRNEADIRSYWDSRMDRDRNGFLLGVLGKYEPESVLEVGCNCGNKLYAVAVEYPGATLAGIEINPLAVELGATWLKEAGIGNVKLMEGRAEDLSRFPGRSFDIVFSWAALIYPRPSKIRETLTDMTRIARKAVVLLEVQSTVTLGRRRAAGVYVMEHWKRDYVSLLTEVASSYGKPNVQWIPKNVWAPGGGGGAIIEICRTHVSAGDGMRTQSVSDPPASRPHDYSARRDVVQRNNVETDMG